RRGRRHGSHRRRCRFSRRLGFQISGRWRAGRQRGRRWMGHSPRRRKRPIEALSLKPEEVRKNFTVSGYVFFPKGQYNQVEMLLVDRETGDTEVVREP